MAAGSMVHIDAKRRSGYEKDKWEPGKNWAYRIHDILFSCEGTNKNIPNESYAA